MNLIIHKNFTKNELSQYLHGCCFSPTISTFTTAIKNGNFSTWPGLTENLISKMLPSPNTAKGHLNQEMANLQSTKIKDDKDFFPVPESPNMKTNLFIASLEKFSATDKA